MALDQVKTVAIDEQSAQEIAKQLTQKIMEENPTGLMRRDTHSKMYGVVKAEFIVESNLPATLAIGLFSTPKIYQTWIRFSNQNSTMRADIKRDIRGMAIKLMGVPGQKLVDSNCSTLDLVLISSPMFIAKDSAEFNNMLMAIQGSIWRKLFFFSLHWRLTWNLLRSLIRITNPLQTKYFSTTPFALGGHVVKYAAIPQIQVKDDIPMRPRDNYLREAMKHQLSSGEACFDFCVQFQKNEIDMPLDNPQKTWPEAKSAFRKVATIRIMSQQFDDTEHDIFGEHLSFSPWRTLQEHRPLGSINRARRVVYEAISSFRHARNDVQQKEPSNWNIPKQKEDN